MSNEIGMNWGVVKRGWDVEREEKLRKKFWDVWLNVKVSGGEEEVEMWGRLREVEFVVWYGLGRVEFRKS